MSINKKDLKIAIGVGVLAGLTIAYCAVLLYFATLGVRFSSEYFIFPALPWVMILFVYGLIIKKKSIKGSDINEQ